MGAVARFVIVATLLTGGVPLMMLWMRFNTPGFASPHEQMSVMVDCINVAGDKAEFCGDPEMKKLNFEIGSAYARALERLSDSPQSRAHLKTIHEIFLTRRELTPSLIGYINEGEPPSSEEDALFKRWAFERIVEQRATAAHLMEEWVERPERRMRGYLRFLNTLAPVRAGLEGRWISRQGEIRIGEDRGSLIVNEAGADRERCVIGVSVDVVDASVKLKDAPPSLLNKVFGATDTLDGWTLRAERSGALLKVVERTPTDRKPDDDRMRPYCNGSAPLAGLYFPAR